MAASGGLAASFDRYPLLEDLAQRAEAALFDSIFLADPLALGDDVAQAARAGSSLSPRSRRSSND